MSTLNHYIHVPDSGHGKSFVNGLVGVIALLLIIYLVWLLCGIGYELFVSTGGQV